MVNIDRIAAPEAVASIAAGADRRALLYDENGDPYIDEISTAQNDDLINVHIKNPLAQKYVIVNYWDKAGSIINVVAWATGGSVTYDVERIAAGTGIGSPTDVTGLTNETAGATRSTVHTPTGDGTEDFVAGQGLAIDLESVDVGVTDFAITIKVQRP